MTYAFQQDQQQRKIASIRVRIEKGIYKVDAVALADAILQSMKEQKQAKDKGQAA